MKKRLWSLILCLVLVCAGFAGCGSKDDEAAGSAVAPEKMVTTKLQEFADSVTDALKKADTETVSTSNQGLDMVLNAEIGEQIASSYGLEGLNSIGMNVSIDAKENAAELRIAGNLLLNGEEVLEAEGITDSTNIYVNLPAYSSQYMGVSYEEMLGKSLEDFASELTSQTAGTPTVEDMLNIWGSFSAKFIEAFEYQSKEEGQTIGTGDYKVTGDKYITTAKAEELDAAIQVLADELKKFPELEVEEIESISDEVDSFNANYYTGKNDAYAWEFQALTKTGTASVIFVSTEKGFCLYIVNEAGEEETLVYSEKESDKKGRITICADDEEIVIEYDNYTKDSVDLSTTVNGMALKLNFKTTDDRTTLDFDVNVLGIAAEGKLETSKNNFELTATVTTAGMKLATVNLSAKARDFVDYTVPSAFVDMDTWGAGLDQEKLMGDLSQLMMKFPFLMDLLQ